VSVDGVLKRMVMSHSGEKKKGKKRNKEQKKRKEEKKRKDFLEKEKKWKGCQ
jgi:hypothetical protein